MKAIADTGWLVAFANKRDFHHRWAVELADGVNEPVLTCEAVLAETAFHLGSTAVAIELVRCGMIQLSFTLADHMARIEELAARYRDRSPDLADLCLIRMSELHPRFPVITTDVNDFSVYRRGRRELIPLVHP